MAKTMTPSADRKLMTDGQIDKVVAAYRAMVLKHRDELGSEAVQQVISSDGYLNEQVGVLRKRVEVVSNLIVRRVKVDRTRTPQEVIKATGRTNYLNDEVVEIMPHGEGEEVDVCFFTLGRYVNDLDLDKEFEFRGLKPADPYSTAAVNEEDPTFGDEKPNATHWKDGEGKWCHAVFVEWRGERDVDVDRSDHNWDDGWWFAGLRK